MTHTPAPWTAVKGISGDLQVFGDVTWVAKVATPNDARLISKAPEAMDLLRELDNSRQLTPGMSARVRALLAYVDGE